jgi:hypothetical protein
MRWPFDLAPGFWDELTGWIALQTSVPLAVDLALTFAVGVR